MDQNEVRPWATRRREGYGRFHYTDNAKFCSNARGSAYEVLDHLITAVDEDLIEESLLSDGRKLVDGAVRLINGYMAYLKGAATRARAQTKRGEAAVIG